MLPPVSPVVFDVCGFHNDKRTIGPAELLGPEFQRPDLGDEAEEFFFYLAVVDT